MSKNSPGPWHQNCHIYAADEKIVAEVIDGERSSMAAAPEQIEANTRLILAAPDMLEALKELLADCYLADAINNYRMANARAAVAKAEGKS